MQEKTALPLLKECFERRQPLGQVLHRKMMNLFRQYILVGGMPQSVAIYTETKDFSQADRGKKKYIEFI